MRLRRVPPTSALPDTLSAIRLRQEQQMRRSSELALAAIDHVLYGGSVWAVDHRRWWRRLWDGFVRVATAGLPAAIKAKPEEE